MHIDRENKSVKFWLDPDVSLLKIMDIIEKNYEILNA